MLVFFAVVDTNSVKKLNFSRKKLELSKHAFTVEFVCPHFWGHGVFLPVHIDISEPGVKLTSAEICLSTLWCPEPKNNSSTLETATNVRTFVHRFEAKVWWHYMLKRRS